MLRTIQLKASLAIANMKFSVSMNNKTQKRIDVKKKIYSARKKHCNAAFAA